MVISMSAEVLAKVYIYYYVRTSVLYDFDENFIESIDLSTYENLDRKALEKIKNEYINDEGVLRINDDFFTCTPDVESWIKVDPLLEDLYNDLIRVLHESRSASIISNGIIIYNRTIKKVSDLFDIMEDYFITGFNRIAELNHDYQIKFLDEDFSSLIAYYQLIALMTHFGYGPSQLGIFSILHYNIPGDGKPFIQDIIAFNGSVRSVSQLTEEYNNNLKEDEKTSNRYAFIKSDDKII